MNAAAASHRPDARTISELLAARARALCAELLPAGKPKGNYWTVGGTDNAPGGSMWIHLSGPKAGRWEDGATGEFGDALDLVAAVTSRGDKKAAYAWASAWLGIAGNMAVVQSQSQASRARAETGNPGTTRGADTDVDRRRRAALRLYLEAQQSLAGTPAAAYLAHRGIDLAVLGRQPRALRFHRLLPHRPSGRSFPALIAAINDMSGAHLATHRTWLEQDARGHWIKARVEDPKMTLGSFAGGSIRLWRGASAKPLRDAAADETVVIAEGIETGLSIALACPELRVLSAVSLGNMASIALPPQLRSVILAGDNDVKPKARAAFQRAVERHLDAGRDVRIARSPWGKDFNDVLRETA